MINNRTSGGRRRGRGGSRTNTNNPNRGPSDGNRLDSRARGNASQLHEKYKSLARDAQNQGDRVVQEYYLQFADHYFRILSETNARQDEHRRQRDGGREDDDDGDDREDAAPRETADTRAEAPRASQDRDDTGERPERAEAQPDRAPRTRRPTAPRYDRDDSPGEDEDRIAVDRLPAAISASNDDGDDRASDEAEAEATAPRRRAPRPRTARKPEGEDGAFAT